MPRRRPRDPARRPADGARADAWAVGPDHPDDALRYEDLWLVRRADGDSHEAMTFDEAGDVPTLRCRPVRVVLLDVPD